MFFILTSVAGNHYHSESGPHHSENATAKAPWRAFTDSAIEQNCFFCKQNGLKRHGDMVARHAHLPKKTTWHC